MSQHKSFLVLILLLFYAINATQLKGRPATVDDLDSVKHLYSNTYDKSYDLLQTIESVSLLSPEHGPGYYVVLNAWRILVGDDLFLARLLSVFFSLATICIVYRLASLTGNSLIALSAPLILAFLAYLHYYSQIARVYPLLLLIGGWLLWSYWRTVAGKRAFRWQWLCLFASASALLFVHYFGALLLAAVAIHHVFFVPKNKRWFMATTVMAVGCSLFAVWIPVFLRGYSQSQAVLADTVLAFPEAALTIFRIYSNGLWFLPLLAAAALLILHRRLNPAETYLAIIAAIVLMSLLLLNEITPILTERRMRYSIILSVPLCCALAIALNRLTSSRLLRASALLLWIVASAQFATSDDLTVYTNQSSRGRLSIPHYQAFIYEAHRLPGHNEPILSFHPSAPVSRYAFLTYYRLRLSDWSDVVHVSMDEDGAFVIESGLTTYASLDAIAENSRGIWIAHNPEESSLSAMGSFAEWLTDHFQNCNRFLDKPEVVIDFYLKRNIPCDLIKDEQPFEVSYSNGAKLANFIYELDSDSLSIYLRWLRTINATYSFTVQLFNDETEKAGQLDRVISGDPIDFATFDLAGLAPGDYVAKLIVYDRESMLSQPGVSLQDNLAFEREVDILSFSIPE